MTEFIEKEVTNSHEKVVYKFFCKLFRLDNFHDLSALKCNLLKSITMEHIQKQSPGSGLLDAKFTEKHLCQSLLIDKVAD